MSQIERKWINDSAVNNEKIDSADTYDVTGLRVDSTNAAGGIGIGTNFPLDALHIRRSDTSAGMRIGIDTGRVYRIYTESTGLLNIRDINSSNDRLTIQGEYGRIGVNTTAPTDNMHIQSTSSMASLQLDLNDGVSGRAYQFASDSTGNLIIRDLDAATTRLTLDSGGAFHFASDATIGGNFEVNGTVVIINTEIVIADQLEINQNDDQPALIASQDGGAGNTATVVLIQNNGSGHALTTDNGNVGIGTADPQTKLHLADSATGSVIRLTDLDSSIGGGAVIGKIEFEQRDSNSPGVSALIEAVQENGLGQTGLALSTGAGGSATRRIRIDEAGNVGIGTEDPLSVLHFEGDLLGKVTGSASNIGNTSRRIGTIYMASAVDYSANLNFNSTSTRVTFTTGGGVGIGITNPAGRLEIQNAAGGMTASNYLQITGSIVNDTNHPGIVLKGGNVADNYTTFQTGGGGLVFGLRPGFNSGSAQYYPVLGLNSAASSAAAKLTVSNELGAEKISITSAGRIGIGSTTPIDAVDIGGSEKINIASGKLNTANATGFLFENASANQVIRVGGVQVGGTYGATIPANGMNIAGNVGIGTVASSPLHIWPTTNSNLGIGQTTTIQGDLHLWRPQFSGGAAQQLVIDVNQEGGSNAIKVRHANDDNLTRFLVDGNGNVGIGTSVCTGDNLYVEGTTLLYHTGFQPLIVDSTAGGTNVLAINVQGNGNSDHVKLSLTRSSGEEIRLRTYYSGGLRNELLAINERLLLGGNNTQSVSLSNTAIQLFQPVSCVSTSLAVGTTLTVTGDATCVNNLRVGGKIGIGTSTFTGALAVESGNIYADSASSITLGDGGGSARRFHKLHLIGDSGSFGSSFSGIEFYNASSSDASGIAIYDYQSGLEHFRAQWKGVGIYDRYHIFSDSVSLTPGSTQSFTFYIGNNKGGSWEVVIGGYETSTASAGMYSEAGDLWLAGAALTTNNGSLGPNVSGYFALNGLSLSWSTPAVNFIQADISLINPGHTFNGVVTFKFGISGFMRM